MSEGMILNMKLHDNGLNEFYSNRASNVSGDAGVDLYVPETITIPANSLGFKIDHLVSCEASSNGNSVSWYMYPRSSMGSRTPLRMSNSVGIIDSGYRGNIIGIVDNRSNEDYVVEKRTRLFQACSPTLSSIKLMIVQELSETVRGGGGLGSTGC